jgi:hypothetical protein
MCFAFKYAFCHHLFQLLIRIGKIAKTTKNFLLHFEIQKLTSKVMIKSHYVQCSFKILFDAFLSA